jgi:dynein heavy chain 2
MNFTGVAGNPEIYRKMPDKNSEELNVVYRQAEELFAELKALMDSFFGWTVLGMVDMESLIEENLKTSEDWERNLAMLKTKRKEADKILETHRVKCFTISTIPLKSAIED